MRASNSTWLAGARSTPMAVSGIHAGQNRDRQQHGRIGKLVQSAARGRQHRRPARGMDGQHVHAQRRSRAYGSSHSVGNVMEFQVEKDRVPALEQRLQNRGACGREQLQAHLEPLAGIFQPRCQICCRVGVRYVESDDQAPAGFIQWI
jgi:hypothetical protein